MAIIITSEVTSSVTTPTLGKLSVFYDSDTKNLAAKNSFGNVSYFGGGQRFQTFAFNETNSTSTNLYVGTIYLSAGTLSVSSSIHMGTLTGTDTVTANLFNEQNGIVVATWTVITGQLQTKLLNSSSILLVDDYYSLRFKVESEADTGILRGLRLVFD